MKNENLSCFFFRNSQIFKFQPERSPGQRDLSALKKELEETEVKLDQAKEELRIAR